MCVYAFVCAYISGGRSIVMIDVFCASVCYLECKEVE